MTLSLLSGQGLEFLLRWIHILAGVTWIGLLYYLNFVQGAFMAEAAAAAKPEVTTKLLPRVLWWFRWAAMVTFIVGWVIVAKKIGEGTPPFGYNPYWVSILTGGVLGSIMWFNVWFIIWPNQTVIIETTRAAVAAGKPVEGLGNRPRVALLTSRTNTVLSVPMLFFMAAASHMPWN